MVDLKDVQEAFGTALAGTDDVVANTAFKGSYGTLTVAGGVLTVQCGLDYNNGAQTNAEYTWDGSGVYVKPVPAPKGGSATAMETFLAITDGSSTDNSIRMGFNFNTSPATPTLKPILYNVDNTYTDVSGIASVTYSATNHNYLAFSYNATQVQWWRSTNGTTWVSMGTAAKPAWVSGAQLALIYTTNRVAGSNTNATLDNVNINGTRPYTAPAGSGGGNKGAGFMSLLAA